MLNIGWTYATLILEFPNKIIPIFYHLRSYTFKVICLALEGILIFILMFW